MPPYGRFTYLSIMLKEHIAYKGHLHVNICANLSCHALKLYKHMVGRVDLYSILYCLHKVTQYL